MDNNNNKNDNPFGNDFNDNNPFASQTSEPRRSLYAQLMQLWLSGHLPARSASEDDLRAFNEDLDVPAPNMRNLRVRTCQKNPSLDVVCQLVYFWRMFACRLSFSDGWTAIENQLTICISTSWSFSGIEEIHLLEFFHRIRPYPGVVTHYHSPQRQRAHVVAFFRPRHRQPPDIFISKTRLQVPEISVHGMMKKTETKVPPNAEGSQLP